MQASRKRLAKSEARLETLTAEVDQEGTAGDAGALHEDDDDDRSVESDDWHVTFAAAPRRQSLKSSPKAPGSSAGGGPPTVHVAEAGSGDVIGPAAAASGGARSVRAAARRRPAVVSTDDLKFHSEEELLRLTLPLDDLTLFDAAPSAVLVTTSEGIIVNANAYAQHMLQYESGALLGRAVEIIMPKDFRDGHHAMMECVAMPRAAAGVAVD